MDLNLFSGIEAFGIEGLDSKNLFAEETKETKEEVVEKVPEKTPEEKELEMLLDKTYTCPVCDSSFKNRAVRTGKARLIRMDRDLRQVYEDIEPLKYDIVSCTKCGFSAVSRFFVPMIPSSRKKVMETVGNKYRHQPEPEGIYPYAHALSRYKLALACDVVRNAKASEKAYTCLRAAWLCRSWKETLDPADKAKVQPVEELEKQFITNAYEGFIQAISKEMFPMCGMDEGTMNYLLGALAFELGHIDVAARMISSVIASPSVNSRTKEKARDLKEEILMSIKGGNK